MLTLAAAEFDVLVTLDRSIPFQQVVVGRDIAVLVISAPSSKLEDLDPPVPIVLEALEICRPGAVITVPSAE